MPRINILDIKKREQGLGYDLIEENVKLHPEMMLVPAATLDGTDMRLTVRTDLPTVNFSLLNEGVVESDDKTITRLFQTAFLDQLVSCDIRLLGTGPAAARVLSEKQSGYVEAAIRTSCKQFWYGLQNDEKGFVGTIAQMLNDGDHVIDVAGGTANARQSVFFAALGTNKLEWLLGKNRSLAFDPWKQQTIKVDSGDMEALVSWMHFNPGVRLANRNALLRIKGITTDANKTLTWDMMTDAWQKMHDDLGMIPDTIFMTGRSQKQLRSALVTDLNPNPPLPTEFMGIPFSISHSLITGETI